MLCVGKGVGFAPDAELFFDDDDLMIFFSLSLGLGMVWYGLWILWVIGIGMVVMRGNDGRSSQVYREWNWTGASEIVICSIFIFMSVLDDCVDNDRGSIPFDTQLCCCVRFGPLLYVLFLAALPIRPVSPLCVGSGIFGVHGSRVRVPDWACRALDPGM